MLSVFNNVKVSAISACLPSRQLAVYEYAPNLISQKQMKRFTKSTGFASLYICDENTTACDLCFEAANNLIDKLEIKLDTIDGLVFVSQTPNFTSPATSHFLQDKLHLKEDIICFDVNEGCSGYESGLYLASVLIASKQCQKVLLLVGDTVTKATDPEDRATRLIFGDAGTATLLECGDNNVWFNIKTYGDRYDAIVTNNSINSQLYNFEKQQGVANGCVFMDGMGVMDFTLNDVPDNIMQLMQFVNVSKEDIDLFACHQANKLILQALAEKLDVDTNKLPFLASDTGNTSCASIPLMLCRNKFNNLEKVVLCGFGVGLACATCFINLSDTRFLDVIYYE